MSVVIKRAETTRINYREVLEHSPVANIPGAWNYLERELARTRNVFGIYIKGKIVGVYGLIEPSLMSDRVYIWLLPTDAIEENKFAFVRHSQIVIEDILKDHELIVGDTLVQDSRAFRWMKWLGAVYGEPVGMVVPFVITRDSYAKRFKWTQ